MTILFYRFVDFVNDEDAACAVQYMNNYKVGEYKLLVWLIFLLYIIIFDVILN